MEQERSTLGKQISFAEFLYPKPMADSNIKKVTLRYQDELHEVDVDEFKKIAKEIMIPKYILSAENTAINLF